jgi:6-phosphofructokinase 1
MKIFMSYNFSDEYFVQRVSYHLSKQKDLKPYCYADERHLEDWVLEVGKYLDSIEAFLLFLGKTIGDTQEIEARTAIKHKLELKKSNSSDLKLMLIQLPDSIPLPNSLALFDAPAPIKVGNLDEQNAHRCAQEITKTLNGFWIPDDDLPIGYPFDYEKKIIAEYSKGEISGDLIELGCPIEWPRILKKEAKIQNPVSTSEIGLYRDWDAGKGQLRDEDPQVIAAALTEFHTDHLVNRKLTLPEAGPRKYLHYPTKSEGRLRVGILVSGGIAPGINAVIAGIVERQFLYATSGNNAEMLKVRGYHNGLKALLRDGTQFSLLTPELTASQANLGGSILGTSRAQEFMDADPKKIEEALQKAITRLSNDGIEILYIIGGDGSMRAAHALWRFSQYMGKKISIVGIPKTMDNDILWVWQSFGFLSAVQYSKEVIQQLFTEAKSNPRLCILQLFGSDSGFVVTHAVTASGVCDLFLIPEAPFTLKKISNYMMSKLRSRYRESQGRESTYGMIVMAETAIPLDAEDYLDDPEVALTETEKGEIRSFLKRRRLFGQTPDALRSGGLKLISKVLQQRIRSMEGDYWDYFRVFTNEPRHLIRAIPASTSDIIFAHRLGSLAVDCAMAGYTDFMISQWLTEFVMVPLRLVTLGRKRIPKDGIFYKAARASTGQPADLT